MFDHLNEGRWWDKSVRLVDGCTPVSPGCEHCWSRGMQARFKQSDPNTVVPRWDRIDRLGRGKPKAWAIWNDLFHEAVPDDFIEAVLTQMYTRSSHRFLILTKRSGRMLEISREYGRYADHIWMGVTVESPDYLNRVEDLLQIQAAKRFVSYEPALGPINLDLVIDWHCPQCNSLNNQIMWPCPSCKGDRYKIIDWIIAGCESGPNRRGSETDWFRSIRDQCQGAGVPFFLKQMEINGKVVHAPELDGRQWLEVPDVD